MTQNKFDEIKEKIYEQHKKENYVERLYEIAYSLPPEVLEDVYYSCFQEARQYRYQGEAVNMITLFQVFVGQRIKEQNKGFVLL